MARLSLLSNRLTELGIIFAATRPREALAQTQDAPAGTFERLWSKLAAALYDLYQNPNDHETDFGIAFTVIALFGVGLAYYLTRRALNRVYALLETWRGSRIPSLKIQSYEVVSADRITDLLKRVASAVRFVTLAMVAYFAIPLILSFFPGTRGWVAELMPYLMAPVYQLLWGFVAFLPNLLSIVIIVIVSRYLIRMIRAIFSEISGGRIVFPGFHSEWAAPTSKLLSFLVIVFAVVLVSPYLPGFGSPAFQGISIFLGVLLSLGSTAAIANMVAGTALTYMRPFKVGDRVRIADTLGDVTEKTLLVTRVRTIKNVEITIPNALVLGGHMINFSALADGPGLVLHTTVTIGYDAPWRRVHALLIEAARATPGVLPEPAPFVLQTSLNDFSIAYELNVYTKTAHRSAGILSDLHQHIQDDFNRAGVEIMSPAFSALRDGNTPAMPSEHLPPMSDAKAFRILPLDQPPKNKG
jgi:small-conductance mechanosensitive channel